MSMTGRRPRPAADLEPVITLDANEAYEDLDDFAKFVRRFEAEQVVKDFYRELDPTTTFNPGIGKTSKARGW